MIATSHRVARVMAGTGEMGQETDYLIFRPDDVDLLLMVRVADAGDHYIVASGEADLACRNTHMPKALFA